MKVFLDTEFTDFIDTEMISIGMVTDTGEIFYREVDFNEKKASPFVHEIVIPILGLIPGAKISRNELHRDLLTWLEEIRPEDDDLQICIDYQTDWDLFADAMDYRVPEYCKCKHVRQSIDDKIFMQFFVDTGLPQHHALYDAMANKFAFRGVQKW